MKTVRANLIAVGLLWGGLLSLGWALGANPPLGKAAPPTALPAKGDLAGDSGAALPLDTSVGPAASRRAARQRMDLIPSPPERLRVGLEVLVGGKPIPTIAHQGKLYLPVTKLGTEYTIRVWNHGPRRIAALVSVDGLSVIDGQPASETNPGYLVTPFSDILIKGWRRDLKAVAAFRFVEREKSYAAQMGQLEKVGVISLLVIEEQVWRPRPGLERKEMAAPAKQMKGKVGSIGTEYGREIDSQAYYVPFVRSANRRAITVYYDTVDALGEAGVPVDSLPPAPIEGKNPFAPPPPGYKGR
jgi:hypothetical protein